MERFDAAQAVDLIEQYRISYLPLVPIMMSRLAKLPDIQQRNLSSIECLFHIAAPCPAWLKRTWFDLLGPDRVLEVYAATELVGATRIRGDEWLDHPGSVGKPASIYQMKILSDEGEELPVGEVGEIFMRRVDAQATYAYLGAPPAKTTPDGFTSVGDLGWVDEEGYLYLADRRIDMIISGGANVFPAEVEAALSDHPEVADIAVVGLADQEWGKRVHTIIQPYDVASPPPIAELDAHCRERLMAYKVPKSYDFVARLPRTVAGKLRRSALIADREKGLIPIYKK